MGLDSVELIVSFEIFFDIEISDIEAEKIRSVQQMVDCVAKHLNISDSSTPLKTKLFDKLKSALVQAGLTDNSFSPSDKIFSIINPDDKESWNILSEELSLQIPQPFRGADTFIKKILFSGYRPKYDWKTVTTDQFITAICANNYEKLIDRKSIKTIYEILLVSIAITCDNLGVDIYEVQPEKQFVNDFGID